MKEKRWLAKWREKKKSKGSGEGRKRRREEGKRGEKRERVRKN